MTETMIKRMARAMFKTEPSFTDSICQQRWQFHDLDAVTKSYWKRMARDALAAAREPTEEMQMAMVEAYAASLVAVTKRPEDAVVSSRDTDKAWQAGIDAALAESGAHKRPKDAPV